MPGCYLRAGGLTNSYKRLKGVMVKGGLASVNLLISLTGYDAGLPTHTVKDLQSDGARVRSIMAVGPADFQRLHAVTQHLRLMPGA